MQAKNTALMVASARCHGDPLSQCVRKATEVGVVVPSALRRELEAAGYRVNEDEESHKAEHGYRTFENHHRVLVHAPDGAVAAMGASGDPNDALLHALLGHLRERDIEKFGFVLPLEFHRTEDPAAIKGVNGPDGRAVPDETVVAIREHLAAGRG